MMHEIGRRLVIGGILLPAFLLFGAGDAFSIHVCGHHASGSEVFLAHGDQSHDVGHAGEPLSPPPSQSPESQPIGEGDHEGTCICPGACYAGELVVAPLLSPSNDVPLRALLAPVPQQAVAVRSSRLSLPYVLPLSTAPPTN